MEKQSPVKKSNRFGWIALLVVSAFLLMQHKCHMPREDSVWKPCGERLECYDLPVRLNHSDPHSKIIKIALNRYKAKNQPARRSVLFNQGGPGGSGISFIQNGGAKFAQMLGDDVDLIGFDPRGVQRSIPLKCADNNAATFNFMQHFTLLGTPLLSPDLSEAEFTNLDALYKLLGQSCFKHSGEYLPFLSTANVARDMDKIREFLGMDKMYYWGFSYGTFLGNTYANMFPERVGNMVIDGVVNPTTYSGDVTDFLFDTLSDDAAVFKAFTDACDKSVDCAFKSENKTIDRYNALIERVRAKPLLLVDLPVPALLTAEIIEAATFGAIYKPNTWPAFAEELLAAEQGDGKKIYARALGIWTKEDSCAVETVADTPFSADGTFCADTADSTFDKTVKDYYRIIQEQNSVDRVALEAFTTSFGKCVHFPRFKEQERFAGPWNHTFANPVLVIGNTLDPVTPYHAAVETTKLMNVGHERNAVFLHHNGHGHCSIAQPSKCTIEIIRNYLMDGVLPKEGTVCEPDVPLFGQQKMDVELAAAESIAALIHDANRRH
ncbi:Alpha/Beta hydrolase protein [Gorgonomyces haynaldii]|nr:Alpha/Beta hydrolase protein [Gorgonomyces haynaldii]